jgi:hypothetical protein
MSIFSNTLVLILGLYAATAAAEDATSYQRNLVAAAHEADPKFVADAARGAAWFIATHGSDWSCSSCHTGNPRKPGKHATTGKVISALAPAITPTRFTDAAKSDKWFRRNCNDVVGRECTAAERADVMAFLLNAN